MATDMFMIYQINDAEKNREYRCRSYAYQIEHGFMITTDNYEISYCAKASQGLVPAKIRENMESLNPDKFKIRKFGVSDVIAITAAGKTAFYYVDKEALVKFNGFLAPKAEGSYLILNEGGYQIEGQTDTWKVIDEKNVQEQRFVQLVCEQTKKQKPDIVLHDSGVLVAQTIYGFDCSKGRVHMKIKSSTMDKVFVTCNTIFLVLFVTITLYPVLNTVALSFNDGIDAVRGGIHLWPRIFTLSNYKTVLHQQNILTGAVVSVARTVLGTIFALVTNALLAYIISRKRFLFRSQLSLFWVITMYVNGGMIPTLVLYRNMNLTNSFWVYVIPGMVSAFNVLVMRTFMEGLPSALEESAMIDGANDFTIFTRIISPLCKPVYATVALFVAVGQWNSWFDAMLYNRMNTQYTTLQYELMKLLSSVMQQSGSATTGGNTATAAVTPVTVRSAATVVTMLPIILLYPFLQRYFVSGMTIGSVKE